MTNLKYSFNLTLSNCFKFILTCFKQVFENATAGRNSRSRSVVNSANCELQLPLTVPVPAGSRPRCAACNARYPRCCA